jgi:hypothetical protein
MQRRNIFQMSVFILAFSLTACVGNGGSKPSNSQTLGVQPDGAVVKSIFKMVMTSDATGVHLTDTSGYPANFPVTVINSPSTTMTISTAKITVPPITSAPLSFGSLFYTALQDNNLRVCGASAADHCSTAIIRVYTIGTAGPGFWNAKDGYGMPITTMLIGGPAQTVGLNVAGAVELERAMIRIDQNVLRLADFPILPEFTINTDFTNAGTGTYYTTLVVEYVLLP